MNPKFEARNPTPPWRERKQIPRIKIRRTETLPPTGKLVSSIWISAIRACFEFRYSDFEFLFDPGGSGKRSLPMVLLVTGKWRLTWPFGETRLRDELTPSVPIGYTDFRKRTVYR